MANFTAKEFEALQERARTVLGDLVNSLHAVQDACSRMSEVVASGDSSLSSAWASVASSLQKPIATTENNFNEIDNMMTIYATETIAGEEKAASEMEKINEEISALNTEGEQLVDFSNKDYFDQTVPTYADEVEVKPVYTNNYGHHGF